jgi:hypothetical protein
LQLTPVDDSPFAGAPVTVEHGRPVAAVAFRPGRPEWLTAGWDGTLKLWSFTGESLGGVAHPDGDRAAKVFDVAVHPDVLRASSAECVPAAAACPPCVSISMGLSVTRYGFALL